MSCNLSKSEPFLKWKGNAKIKTKVYDDVGLSANDVHNCLNLVFLRI